MSSAVLACLSAGERAGSGHLDIAGGRGSALLERLEELNGGLGGKVFVVVVVDLDHGGVDASSETLHLDEGEESVGGCLALLDAEFLLDRFHDRVGSAAAELARSLAGCVSSFILSQAGAPIPRSSSVTPPAIKPLKLCTYRGACLDEELADGVSVVHGVERSDFVDAHWGHLEQPSNLVHDADGGETVLALAEVEDRHDSSLLVLRRVSLEDLCDELLILGVELERNIGVVVGRVAVLWIKALENMNESMPNRQCLKSQHQGECVGRSIGASMTYHLEGVALTARGAGYGAGLEGRWPPDGSGG